MGRRYTRRHVPPPARAAAGGVQPDERRDRRLPRRGRARVRDDARAPSRAPGSRRCTSSRTRRGPGTVTARRRPRAAGGEEGARCAAARRLARGVPRSLADEDRPRGRRARRPTRAAATATTTRRGSSTAPVGELVRVARRRGHRRGDPGRVSDCLFCKLVPRGRPRRADRRLRRDPRHQPAGRDAPARHPRAARRHVPRDRASSRPTRRSACSTSSPRSRQAAGLTDYRVVVNVGAGRRPDDLPPALARARRRTDREDGDEPDRRRSRTRSRRRCSRVTPSGATRSA